jgi:hypothetical protein
MFNDLNLNNSSSAPPIPRTVGAKSALGNSQKLLPPPPSTHGGSGAKSSSIKGDVVTAAGGVGVQTATGSTVVKPLNLTSVAFAGTAPVIAVGNASGGVDVYKVVNLDMCSSGTGGAWDIAEQVKQLQAAIGKGGGQQQQQRSGASSSL